ncbi:MAG: hypothetical protein GIKADHBN_00655 [Phycisphaerales bacterium]|nr:hypothetical protein [Phycisphaerales bacterium]
MTEHAPARDAPASDASRRQNSLRLDPARLGKLLDLLDAREGGAGKANRQYVRWPFRHPWVQMIVTHSGGSRASIGVASRNISCGGLSVLHNAFLHPKNECVVAIPKCDGGTIELQGIIARCTHVSGIVHEIGIKFDREVRVGDFIADTRQVDVLSIERVDKAALSGQLLLCGASELDSQVIGHYLRDTGLEMRSVATVDDAVKLSPKSIDFIFLDADFDVATEPPASERLRSSGFSAPMVVLVSSETATSMHPSTRLKADATLVRPISDRTLLQVIAGLMRGGAQKGLTISSLEPHDPSFYLAESFVEEVRRHAESLDQAVRARQAEACLALCRKITGIAPLVGFEGMSSVARRAEAALVATMRVQDAALDLHHLISACMKARTR